MHKGQIDRFLSLLERAVAVAERWADREYPKIDAETEAELYRQGEQKAEPQTVEEYRALEEPEGRFARRFREAHPETR